MGKLIATSLTIALACLLTPAHAEVIKLPIGKQAAEKQQMSRPLNGMTRAQVNAHFGEPLNATAAVGDPPISSWEYADFFVYFEYDLVIHTVLKHVPVGDAAQAQP